MATASVDNRFLSVLVRARTREQARRKASHEVRSQGHRIVDVVQVTIQRDERSWLVGFQVAP